MSGGSSSMQYDQETTVYNASCLSHDVVDLFSMLTDCALEPQNSVAAAVGIHKNKQALALESKVGTGHEFVSDLTRTAYGLQGLGMPTLGLPSNVEYLSALRIQEFQMRNIYPQRIIIGAANIENHQEFVELVEQNVGSYPPQDQVATREASYFQNNKRNYIGGEVRKDSESNKIDIALVYETQGWDGSDLTALQLAAALFGEWSITQQQYVHTPQGARGYTNCTPFFNFSGQRLFLCRQRWSY